jgi:hypothetical protein
MSSRRHASKPYNLSLFLGHSKGKILKKNVTHKAGDLPGAQAERTIFFLFQAWDCSNFVENCSNFIKARSATTCCTNNAEPISELYFGGFFDADLHTLIIEDWVSLKINRYRYMYDVSQSYSVTSKKKEVTVGTCGTTNALK